jgi:polyhydroxybutyrate depolymerase
VGARARSRLVLIATVAVVALAVGCAAVPGIDDDVQVGPSVPTIAAGATPPETAPPATGPARPSFGCFGNGGSGDLTPFDGPRTIPSGGQKREILLHVPANLQPAHPAPFVLDMHGIGTSALLQQNTAAWNDLADREGVVIAHPQGVNNIWQFAPDDNNADITFLRTVVEQVGHERCIDTSRTYATGISMGSLMAGAMACRAPELFAAFGFVSGMQFKPVCADAPPRPALVFWGEKDCVLPWFGGMGPCLAIGGPHVQPTEPVPPDQDLGFPPVENVLKEWSGHNGCSGEPATQAVSASVTLRTYTGCQPGADLALYFVSGGGHTWPGSKLLAQLEQSQGAAKLQVQGTTTLEIDATELIWTFFQRYQLPAAPP